MIHACSGATGHTDVVVANIIFGTAIPGDAELRLCGDVRDGARAVELGVSPWGNAITFASNGAKSIAVDPDPARLADVRNRAELAEVTVQCLQTDLADLGDITSGTCDVVVAAQTLADVDDLSRLLRQVHRILKPSMPFVISTPHPYATVSDEAPYGSGARTVGEWFVALGRSNFRVDHLVELGVTRSNPSPTTLILRARKEGS
jgi:SAM-dependent methyltransferase